MNGFLIPGGSAPLRPGHSFFDTAAEVVRLAKLANQQGDAFPILGICLGFEALAIITSGNTSIMSRLGAITIASSALGLAAQKSHAALTSEVCVEYWCTLLGMYPYNTAWFICVML